MRTGQRDLSYYRMIICKYFMTIAIFELQREQYFSPPVMDLCRSQLANPSSICGHVSSPALRMQSTTMPSLIFAVIIAAAVTIIPSTCARTKFLLPSSCYMAVRVVVVVSARSLGRQTLYHVYFKIFGELCKPLAPADRRLSCLPRVKNV